MLFSSLYMARMNGKILLVIFWTMIVKFNSVAISEDLKVDIFLTVFLIKFSNNFPTCIDDMNRKVLAFWAAVILNCWRGNHCNGEQGKFHRWEVCLSWQWNTPQLLWRAYSHQLEICVINHVKLKYFMFWCLTTHCSHLYLEKALILARTHLFHHCQNLLRRVYLKHCHHHSSYVSIKTLGWWWVAISTSSSFILNVPLSLLISES